MKHQRSRRQHRLTRSLTLYFLQLLSLLPLVTRAAVHDATIVTDLRVVHGASDAAAREACAAMCPCRDRLTAHVTTNWFVVGSNLHTSDDDRFTYLCVRRDRRTAVERDGGSLFALQSISVVENAQTCPPSMTTLFEPRDGVVVCMQPVAMAHALATGTYISDVDAVRNRTTETSSNGGNGWISEPTSVHSSNQKNVGVFLRFKRPVRPIADLRFLSGVDATTSGATACRRQLNASWEPAGIGYVVDESGHDKRTILCVQRAYLPSDQDDANAPPRVLTQIQIKNASSPCASGYQAEVTFSSLWKACFMSDDSQSARQFITHVVLTTSAETNGKPLTQDLGLASTIDLNNASRGLSTFMMIKEAQSPSQERQLRANGKTVALAADAKPLDKKPPLRARLIDAEKAKPKLAFKILQIADLHLTGDPDYYCWNPPHEHSACGMQCTENLTIGFYNDLLDEEKPDLVMFSGDTITVREWGLKDAAMDAALGPVESRGIPYAWIMGNHDDDYVFDRQEIMDRLVTRELAYTESGPSTIQGVGNYALSVKPPLASDAWGSTNDSVFRMYFLDSNKNHDATLFPDIKSRYDWIRKEQIAFYRNLSLANRETDTNGLVPAIMFFHIAIPEYSDLASYFFRHGEKNEKLEGPDYNSGLLTTLAELQEVKATFVGHDHTNEYCYKMKGVQLCYGGGTGFGAAYYQGDVSRRARVIEWTMDSDNKRRITSWKRHFGHKFHSRQREEELYSEA